MISKYFLAANSAGGFFSLYPAFPPDGGYLHIIKGGPGTGKSTFMRRIGLEAERRGYKVEYVFCSGDTRSLDGIYIRELREGWADGTAPHTAEPALFGVDADYVNLGQFCGTPLLSGDAEKAYALNAEIKTRYAEAYRLLFKAGCERRAKGDMCALEFAEGRLRGRRCFLSAISRDGVAELYEETPAEYETETVTPEGLMRALQSNSAAETVICLDPLLPDCAEAVLFPDSRMVLRTIAPESGYIEKAVRAIGKAGDSHDELEGIYKQYMDYEALNDFIDEYLAALFCYYVN